MGNKSAKEAHEFLLDCKVGDHGRVKAKLDVLRSDSAKLSRALNGRYEDCVYEHDNMLQELLLHTYTKHVFTVVHSQGISSPPTFEKELEVIRIILSEPLFNIKHTNQDNGRNLLHSFALLVAEWKAPIPVVQDFFAKVTRLIVDRFVADPTAAPLVDAKRLPEKKPYNATRDFESGGYTPLSIAAYVLSVPLTLALLETRLCDLNAADSHGNTPLHYIANGCAMLRNPCTIGGIEHLERTQLELLEAFFSFTNDGKCDVARTNNEKRNILHVFLASNEVEPDRWNKGHQNSLSSKVLALMVATGKIDANARSRDDEHSTPLFLACKYRGDRVDLVQILLNAGAAQKIDAWFFTADDCDDDEDQIAKKLESTDTATSRRDQDTCLTIALKKRNIKIAEFLMSLGCDQSCLKQVRETETMVDTLEKVNRSLLKSQNF